jgi:hypothetical protein
VAGREGTTLGPYRLTRHLGGGGAGDVYLAEGPAHGGAAGTVAVKVLRGSSTDAAARAIAGQAQAVSDLHLTHILPIYAVGEADGALYIAMAYAPAGSLGVAVGPHGVGPLQLPLGAGVVARLVIQTARALQAVHERGLVHGDLKPDNLFVRTAPHGGPMAAVADFGQSVVVSAAAAAAASATGENAWAASALLCAAPEQLNGQVTPASDQYALATIAYLLLTGRYPFSGDARGLGMALLHEAPTPPSRIDPALSPAADAVLLRALAKHPDARYPNVGAFAQALDEALAASKGTGVSQAFSLLAGMTPAASASGTAAGPAGSGVRRRPAADPYAGPIGASASGIRRAEALVGAGSRPTGVQPPARDSVAALWRHMTPRQRTLALAACALAVVMVAVGGLGLRALTAPLGTIAPIRGLGGLNYAPTLTPDTTQIARQLAISRAAQALLTTATSASPVFSDSLKTNSQRWPVDGRSTFFGADGRLHLANQSARNVLTVDQPVSAPARFAVTVDLAFVSGGFADPAGLRFRVGSGSGSAAAFYAAMISPEGRYEFWRYDQAHWAILANGYTDTVKRGLGQTNTLAVLVDPTDPDGSTFLMFVNGQYVVTVTDNLLPADPALGMGLIVMYSGTEVAYSNYALYQA